ncbi:hypothetical protein PDJ84_25395 [Bacillus cereus]|uniref:hypothetical protein n=1 Tax=Bacillus cereus TaxID=1396 RepID=UPI001F210FF1|nr:hypothetical protein [Bacillus cereus]MDA1521280.1 hypothetical protein [Bacillus cereus]
MLELKVLVLKSIATELKKVIEEFFPGDEIIEVTYTNIDDYNEVFAVFVDSDELIGENGSSYIAMLRQNLRSNYKVCLADELDSLELDLITHPFKVVDNTPHSLHSYLQKMIMVNSKSDLSERNQDNSGSNESRGKNNDEIESHIVEEVKIRKLNTPKNEQDKIVQNETVAVNKYSDEIVAAVKENHLEKPLENINDNNSKNDICSRESNVVREEIRKEPVKRESILAISEETYEKAILNLRDYINIPVHRRKLIGEKVIGVWSPISRVGVTSFLTNLAVFLANYSISISVLEGVSNTPKLYSYVQKFMKIDERWISLSDFLINPNQTTQHIPLHYKGITFFPFNRNNYKCFTDNIMNRYYIEGLRFFDLVFLDIPSGPMVKHTLESLRHIDELWILCNNDVYNYNLASKFITQKINPKVDTKLIFIDQFEFSKPKIIQNMFESDILFEFPSIFEEVAKIQYSNKLFVEDDATFAKLKPGFEQIMNYLIPESNFKGSYNDESNVKRIWNVVKKIIINP